MLKDQEIIYIANDWFNENKTSAHHIAEVLSRDNKLLYVEAAGMRSPRASRRDFGKILTKFKRFFAKPVRIDSNTYRYSPVVIPFHRYAVVRAFNRVLLWLMLGHAARVVGFKNPILWIFMPHYHSVLKSLRNKVIVYYVVDEYSSQPKVDVEVIQLMERDILRHADVVFTVSEELLETKRSLNPNTYLSPHGVDVALFNKAAENSSTAPSDIARIKRPIAGYFGLVEEWTDLALLDYLSTELPHMSFVLIGRVAQDVGALEKKDNVHFLGQKPYDELPEYLRSFDVCLLLYKMEAFAQNANPKKLREYLAGGKPVVSVRVREVEKYGNLVYIAHSYEEYKAMIVRALEENSDARVAERLNKLKSESWESRVARLGEIVNEHIAKRAARS